MAKKIQKIIKYFLMLFGIASVGFFIVLGISDHLPIFYLLIGTILISVTLAIAFRLIYLYMSKYYIPRLYGVEKTKDVPAEIKNNDHK